MGGFITEEDENVDLTFSSFLTLVDKDGKVLQDSIFSTFENLGIVYVANIPGTDQFYTLMSGLSNPTLLTIRWNADFTYEIIDEVNFESGVVNSDYIFRYRKNVDGNLLFHSDLSSFSSDWLLVFEINSTGNIMNTKLVEELYCECLIQKLDKSGYYCLSEFHLDLNNNFEPIKLLELPEFDLNYFGLDAGYAGDTIIVSANVLTEDENTVPVLFSFNRDMEFLDSIHLAKDNFINGFVFKNLAISNNKQIMHGSVVGSENSFSNEFLLTVTDPSFSDLKQHSVYQSEGELLGVSIAFNEPNHLYFCGLNNIDFDDELYEPSVIKILSSILTSTKELSSVPEFNISPNPVVDDIRLSEIIPGQTSYKILHQNGQVVKDGSLLSNEISSISVNGLPSGYYILLISDHEKFIGKSIFIKI